MSNSIVSIRPRLTQHLIEKGYVTEDQCNEALERQVVFGGKLGTNLLELFYINEDDLVEALSHTYRTPKADPDKLKGIPDEVIAHLPQDLAEKHRVVPFEACEKRISLAMMEPTNVEAMDEIAFITGKIIKVFVTTEMKMGFLLKKYYGVQRDRRFISIPEEEKQRRKEWEEQKKIIESEKAAAKLKEEEAKFLAEENSFSSKPSVQTSYAKEKTRENLNVLINNVTRSMEADICSVIRINQGNSMGIVEATSEDPEFRNFKIDLMKYPKVMQALNKKHVALIANAEMDAQSTKVMEKEGRSSLVVVPLVYGEDLIGAMMLNTTRPRQLFKEREISFLKGTGETAKTALLNADYYARMDREGKNTVGALDPLTGLQGYYGFMENAEREIYRARRYQTPLSLIRVDISKLGKINEKFGYEGGNEVLREVGRLVINTIRKCDVAARCLGDDFYILLPETNQSGSTIHVQRLLDCSNKNPLLHKLDVSLFAGIATIEETRAEKPMDLILAAEIELERSKNNSTSL